ncbi:MAG: hypothetical protein E6H73_06125 [Betaproteobacteria bacterium]|nr:MAG: hypothetical protein E6H73_06125 [Betaproteobacteria bacterium]
MGNLQRYRALVALSLCSLLGTPAAVYAAGYVETDLVVNQQVNNVPTLTDKNGIVHVAKFFDPNLVNPWGVGESATSPFWVSDNGAGVSSSSWLSRRRMTRSGRAGRRRDWSSIRRKPEARSRSSA